MSYPAHKLSIEFHLTGHLFSPCLKMLKFLHNLPTGNLYFVSEDPSGKLHYVEKKKCYFTTKDLGLLVDVSFLLKSNWHAMFYYFQVHNIFIRQYIHYSMLPTIITIHYYNIADYIPYVMLFQLFYNWKPVSLNPFHLFRPLPPQPPLWPLVCSNK